MYLQLLVCSGHHQMLKSEVAAKDIKVLARQRLVIHTRTHTQNCSRIIREFMHRDSLTVIWCRYAYLKPWLFCHSSM